MLCKNRIVRIPESGKKLSDFGVRIVNLPTDANPNPHASYTIRGTGVRGGGGGGGGGGGAEVQEKYGARAIFCRMPYIIVHKKA